MPEGNISLDILKVFLKVAAQFLTGWCEMISWRWYYGLKSANVAIYVAPAVGVPMQFVRESFLRSLQGRFFFISGTCLI